ncbi:MAG: EcoRII N-terminal effector-binding domain-containing protein [Sulfitobacter sp.]|uniref:EcoRII N-terminal effector-binding domain-containing protein n=1 Tax=Sulfitobacter sp. TaxID=1903071 RepID=UPI003299E533
MTRTVFQKTLSANDVGATGGHQGGVLIPKSEHDLLAMLPTLNPDVKNPDAWINCIDDLGAVHEFRFVYYNNKLHDQSGTRNEYRITWMTSWFRSQHANEGDVFEISKSQKDSFYRIRVICSVEETIIEHISEPARIKLRGWRRIH